MEIMLQLPAADPDIVRQLVHAAQYQSRYVLRKKSRNPKSVLLSGAMTDVAKQLEAIEQELRDEQ